MSNFVTGLELSRRRYEQVVKPLLRARFPGMLHSAALLGRGSEVLGFDDEMSTDHDWGPRVLIFVAPEDLATRGEAIRDELARSRGVPGDGEAPADEIHSVAGFLDRELGLGLDEEWRASDWLTLPEHTLATITSGAVFHDEVGLEVLRARLAHYPRDVWLYLMLAGWWRIHPEMNLTGRAGYVGDELGSSVLGARMVHDLMRLCFLMERRYAPYSKWFGTAFSRLACGPDLTPVLLRVLHADSWQQREHALADAYARLTAMHNRLALTATASLQDARLWDRPFRVAWASIPDLLFPLIEDPDVLALAERWPAGPVDRLRELTWSSRDQPRVRAVLDEAP